MFGISVGGGSLFELFNDVNMYGLIVFFMLKFVELCEDIFDIDCNESLYWVCGELFCFSILF